MLLWCCAQGIIFCVFVGGLDNNLGWRSLWLYASVVLFFSNLILILGRLRENWSAQISLLNLMLNRANTGSGFWLKIRAIFWCTDCLVWTTCQWELLTIIAWWLLASIQTSLRYATSLGYRNWFEIIVSVFSLWLGISWRQLSCLDYIFKLFVREIFWIYHLLVLASLASRFRCKFILIRLIFRCISSAEIIFCFSISFFTWFIAIDVLGQLGRRFYVICFRGLRHKFLWVFFI